MKAKFIIIIAVLLLYAPLAVYADQKPSLDKLNEISDEALQMVKLNRSKDANRILEHFSDEFLRLNGNGTLFSMDELRIITVAHEEAVIAVNTETMSYNDKINRLTKFRLAVDAISSTHQPLWTEMEGPIMTVFKDVKQAALDGDRDEFQFNLNSFLDLYNVIYPSMKIDITPEKVQQLDTKVNFIDQYRPQMLHGSTGKDELDALESDLKNMFDEMTEDEADPSLWWVIISTGSIIILTLSYVGWRKYKGNKDMTRNIQKQRKN